MFDLQLPQAYSSADHASVRYAAAAAVSCFLASRGLCGGDYGVRRRRKSIHRSAQVFDSCRACSGVLLEPYRCIKT